MRREIIKEYPNYEISELGSVYNIKRNKNKPIKFDNSTDYKRVKPYYYTREMLSKEYFVSIPTIKKIISLRLWKHI